MKNQKNETKSFRNNDLWWRKNPKALRIPLEPSKDRLAEKYVAEQIDAVQQGEFKDIKVPRGLLDL
jgi:hypothetical protein